MIQTLLGLPRKYRRTFVVIVHLGLVALTSYLAYWLRFDGAIPRGEMRVFTRTLPWVIAVRLLTFAPFRLYEGLWRYTSLWDLRRIVAGVAASSVAVYVTLALALGEVNYPRSIFIIDPLLLVVFMGGVRLTPRVYRDMVRLRGERRLLIVGAGDDGEKVVREIRQNVESTYEPIGFIDDDEAKRGRRIHGVPVLGTREDLPAVMAAERPHEVLLAMPRAAPSAIRDLVKRLEPFKIPITTVPQPAETANGHTGVGDIRQLSVADLLTRAPVGMDSGRLRRLIAARRVMVTGAGGSIGSELCRQIAAFDPALLVPFERHEHGLYAIAGELGDRHPGLTIQPVLGDVTDDTRLEVVFAERRPEIVFHAAAHKHVPLMELNPCEAVRNNVAGTRMVIETAIRHGTERLILISTDKAVNPSSVMGASKRVAELLVQAKSRRGRSRLITVRFGNVLGSNGSVVPRFLDQIKSGGPVTVTDPEVRRYFMLIPEAVQLVLQAGALGEGGETFVLEMGEQIKVLDLARNLIRLSGFVPEREVPVTFIGLRPGEKLVEELVSADEVVERLPAEQIVRVRPDSIPDPSLLEDQVAELERLAACGDAAGVIDCLMRVVPSYRPSMKRGAERRGFDAAV